MFFLTGHLKKKEELSGCKDEKRDISKDEEFDLAETSNENVSETVYEKDDNEIPEESEDRDSHGELVQYDLEEQFIRVKDNRSETDKEIQVSEAVQDKSEDNNVHKLEARTELEKEFNQMEGKNDLDSEMKDEENATDAEVVKQEVEEKWEKECSKSEEKDICNVTEDKGSDKTENENENAEKVAGKVKYGNFQYIKQVQEMTLAMNEEDGHFLSFHQGSSTPLKMRYECERFAKEKKEELKTGVKVHTGKFQEDGKEVLEKDMMEKANLGKGNVVMPKIADKKKDKMVHKSEKKEQFSATKTAKERKGHSNVKLKDIKKKYAQVTKPTKKTRGPIQPTEDRTGKGDLKLNGINKKEGLFIKPPSDNKQRRKQNISDGKTAECRNPNDHNKTGHDKHNPTKDNAVLATVVKKKLCDMKMTKRKAELRDDCDRIGQKHKCLKHCRNQKSTRRQSREYKTPCE